MPGMGEVVERLAGACLAHSGIVVWGDYDADGLTSAAMMTRALSSAGACVEARVPERAPDGYGLGRTAVDLCLARKPSLLLAVDCGTSSATETAELAEAGIDTVVIDHHESEGTALAKGLIANPRLGGDAGSAGELSAAGLCFHACRGLRVLSGSGDGDMDKALALACVGTICDVVPLRGDGRTIASCGLGAISSGAVPGLTALARSSGIAPGPLRGEDVAYRIGPRLNACGRVGSAADALELLLCEDGAALASLAAKVEKINSLRRTLDRKVCEEAFEQASRQKGRSSIFLADRGWHPGVVGIAASRLSSELGIPVVLASIGGDGLARGSARSIPGVPLNTILQSLSDLLVSGGGHRQAAGLTFRMDVIDELAARFDKAAAGFSESFTGPVVYLDGRLAGEDLTPGLARSIRLLEPFGEANEEPVWITSGIRMLQPRRMGDGKHFSCQARTGDRSVRAVAFGMGAVLPDAEIDYELAYSLRLDTYRGGEDIVIHIKDMRPVRQ